jgi:hypothetical protein
MHAKIHRIAAMSFTDLLAQMCDLVECCAPSSIINIFDFVTRHHISLSDTYKIATIISSRLAWNPRILACTFNTLAEYGRNITDTYHLQKVSIFLTSILSWLPGSAQAMMSAAGFTIQLPDYIIPTLLRSDDATGIDATSITSQLVYRNQCAQLPLDASLASHILMP